MNLVRLAAAVAALATQCALAGVNEWTSVGPPGGIVHDVDYASSDVALAVTGDGIYRTEDDGQTWIRVLRHGKGGVGSIAVNPANADEVLVVTGDFIQRSVDAGLTWNFPSGPVAQVDHPRAIAWSADGSVAWVSTLFGKVFRSDNLRVNWQDSTVDLPTTGGFAAMEIEIDAVDREVVYVRLSNGKVYRRTTSGGSWTDITPPAHIVRIAASRLTADVLLASSSAGTFRSEDRGTSWTAPNAPLEFSVLEFQPQSAADVFAATTDGAAWVSVDGGATWTPHSDLPVSSARAIGIRPGGAQMLISAGSTLLATSNGGTTWIESASGIREADFGRFAVAQDGKDVVYANTYDTAQLYRRDPITGTWVGVAQDSARVFGVPQYSAYGMAVHPNDADTVFLVRNGRIGRSSDAGAQWANLGQLDASSLTFDPVDPQVQYATAVAVHGFKTVNGGGSWTPLTVGEPRTLYPFVVDPANPSVIYAVAIGLTAVRILKSNDGGTTWAAADTGIPANAVVNAIALSPEISAVLYAATSSGLYKSGNAGLSWSLVHAANDIPGIVAVVIDPNSPNLLYASAQTGARAFRSIDAGDSWEEMPALAPSSDAMSWKHLAVLPTRSTTIIATSDYAGLHEMEIAADLRLSPMPTTFIAVGTSQTVPLVVTNHGPLSGTEVRMAVSLPRATGAYDVQTDRGICVENLRHLNCSFDALRPNEAANVSVTFTPEVEEEELVATLSAYERIRYPQALTNTTRRLTDIHGSLSSSTGSITTGANATLTLTIVNDGPSPTTFARATIPLLQPFAFVSATSTALTCSSNTGTITCEGGALAAGASAQAEIVITSATPGSVDVLGNAEGDALDIDPTNNALAAVSLTASAPPPPPSPPPASSGGGGGGGSMHLLLLALCAVLRTLRLRSGREASVRG